MESKTADLTPEKTLDEIETFLLFLLEGDEMMYEKFSSLSISQNLPRSIRKEWAVAQETFLCDKFITPKKVGCPLTCLSDGRLFDPSGEMLLAPANEIIGDGAEVALESDGMISWVYLERIKRLPKYFFTYSLSRDCAIYELHSRRWKTLPSRARYIRTFAGYDPHTRKAVDIVPDYNHKLTGNKYVQEFTYVINSAASVIEDSRLFWHIKVEHIKRMLFYSDEQALKSLADLRDEPRVPAGRRRPILHWVSSHLRRRPRPPNELREIDRHLRGITEFPIDVYSFQITNPSKK